MQFGALLVYLCALFLLVIAVCFVGILVIVAKIKKQSDKVNKAIIELLKKKNDKI